MEQARPQTSPGIKEMYPEVEVIGITLPIEQYMGALRPKPGENLDDLVADAGRTCYQTNDLATHHSNRLLVKNMGKSGHYSVLEHGSVTLRIRGISRACTHQLVRHRHQAISQESQRYCDEGDFGYICPPTFKAAGLEEEFHQYMLQVREQYLKFQAKLHLYQVESEASFRVNEDARFLLPNAVQSEIVITPNMAELRWMFIRRLTTHAQWEIRQVMELILSEMTSHTVIFNDISNWYNTHGDLDTFTVR